MNVYPYFKQQLLNGGADRVDLDGGSIKALLLNGHTYDAADHYVADVLADAGTTEVARSGALTGVTLTINGNVVNVDFTDETVAAVNNGTITDVVLFHDTGADATSQIICHIDQDSGAGAISLVTNGSDVLIQAPSGVFDL